MIRGHRISRADTVRVDNNAIRLLALPAVPMVVLVLLAFAPAVEGKDLLMRSLWAAALVLLVWLVALFIRSGRSRAFALRIEIRSQHYIQALMQFSVFAYWGFFWRPVYEHAPLILAQLAFAYAFEMVLIWSRRDTYTLGFGVFPIVFSTNLFLWFRDDWFYLQFAVIAVGLLGKEFVRWNRDGKDVHVFNPSAFTLALFAVVLIATGTTDLTWGQSIGTSLTLAPHFYLFMFCVGLVVMYFFSITPITAAATATLFGLSALYAGVTGVPYFVDSEIPAAVFLGLHLLVTDPSTTPRTSLGKAIFGVLYGLGVFGLFALLGALGAPTFYDKLLCVPLLNLSVQHIDRWATALRASSWRNGERGKFNPNLAHMAVWVAFFGLMTIAGKTDGMQRGDSVPFWQQACLANRASACERLIQVEASYCSDKSAWACNELGLHYTRQSNAPLAGRFFARACELRFQPACVNLLDPQRMAHADPKLLDLRLMLRERGLNLMDASPVDLYVRACQHRWAFACAGQVSAR